MKSERQLVAECIEEKTKDLHQAMAQLRSLEGGPSSSFVQTHIIMARFDTQQKVNRLKYDLDALHEQYRQMEGDIKEEELIKTSKEGILKCLSGLPDGIYKLIKVVERERHGEE